MRIAERELHGVGGEDVFIAKGNVDLSLSMQIRNSLSFFRI